MEEEQGTAVEQYFNQLIRMRLLTHVYVSDRQGNTILACFGDDDDNDNNDDGKGTATSSSPRNAAAATHTVTSDNNNNDSSGGGGNEEATLLESNVVLSGARCLQNLELLQLGTPAYISAQYRDAVVVQTLDRASILTLVGSRSQGHGVGSLLALLPQVRATRVYDELMCKVHECFQ